MGSPAGSPLRWLLLAAVAILLGYVGGGIYLVGLDRASLPANNTTVIFKGGFALGQRIKGRSWTATYRRIVTNADQTILDLDDVTDGIVYKNGKKYLYVRAKHMTVNTLTHDFSASGAIRIETADPDSPHRIFVTDAAAWSDATQRLSLPRKATIETGTELPLTVGRVVLDVKTGQIELTDVAGAVKFK